MEELFAQRLSELIKNSNYILADMEEAVGKKGATISRYASGEIKGVKRHTIVKLANFFGVSPAWLAGLSNEKYELKAEDLLKKIGATPLSDIQTVPIPILGTVKAGYDYLAQENIIDYIGFKLKNTDVENYYALNIVGDSMTPLFDDGDTVLIHKQDDFQNGDNCVVLINGEEATVKQVYKGNTGIELKAVNPYYPPRIFTKEDMKTLPVKVIGIVEKSIRNFKNK